MTNHKWLQILDELELELFEIWKKLEKKYGSFDADVNALNDCVEKIRNFRTVDVQEVKHEK